MSREEQVATRKQEQDLERDDWAWLMSHPQGRRIVQRDLLKPASLDLDMFAGNSRDAYNEGRRSLAREVLKRAKGQFDHYLTMLKEHHNG